MPKRLSGPEIKRFLRGRHVCVLGTINEDGSPLLTPIWYLFENGRIAMRTDEASVKAANIRRDNRVSVCVQDERPPYKSITAYGTATIEQARPELGARIARHYLGFVGGIGYQRTAQQGIQAGVEEVTVVVTADRYLTQDFSQETPIYGRWWLLAKRLLPPWL